VSVFTPATPLVLTLVVPAASEGSFTLLVWNGIGRVSVTVRLSITGPGAEVSDGRSVIDGAKLPGGSVVTAGVGTAAAEVAMGAASWGEGSGSPRIAPIVVSPLQHSNNAAAPISAILVGSDRRRHHDWLVGPEGVAGYDAGTDPYWGVVAGSGAGEPCGSGCACPLQGSSGGWYVTVLVCEEQLNYFRERIETFEPCINRQSLVTELCKATLRETVCQGCAGDR
jgi:hypothetical protein